jgi:hypothetical protein
MRYSFEKDGINFDVIFIDEEFVQEMITPPTHHCKLCGLLFITDANLAKCPNGCEGLIKREENENIRI